MERNHLDKNTYEEMYVYARVRTLRTCTYTKETLFSSTTLV